jgi:hypothetical protein
MHIIITQAARILEIVSIAFKAIAKNLVFVNSTPASYPELTGIVLEKR